MQAITEEGYKEKYQKLYAQHDKLTRQYKKEVIDNHEREERNKKTRFDLMMENNRLNQLYENLQDDLYELLGQKKTGDNS